MSNRRTKKIFKQVRNANLKYNLIENGDKIAAAMSGGKDSYIMLYSLTMLQKFTPLMFEVVPVNIDLGWQNDVEPLRKFCERLDLTLHVEPTNIGQVVFDCREENNPCALCANLRRGAINRVSKELNCNKVDLGHHLDDVVHTLFLSILFEGRHNVFKPKTYLDRMDITFIRPLIYVEERDIELLTASLNLIPVVNRCPADGQTRRADMKVLLDTIEKDYPGARKQFLSSLENIGPDSFWKY